MMRFLFLFLILPFLAKSQSALINLDTAKLNKAHYRDSASVRKLIDTVYTYKEMNLENAVRLARFAINRALDLKNKSLEGGAYNVLGAIFSARSEHQSAIEHYYKALRSFEKSPGAKRIPVVLNNIGMEYNFLNQPDNALRYLKEAESMARKNGDNYALALVNSNFLSTYIQKGSLDKALECGLKANRLITAFKLEIGLSVIQNNIGALYFYQKNYSKALYFFRLAEKSGLRGHNMIDASRARLNIGEMYEITGDGDALPLYLQAYNHASSIKDYAMVETAANNLSNYYSKRNRYKEALDYFQKSSKAGDLNSNAQASKSIAEIQTKYETEKKQQKINILSKQNTINQLTIGRQRTTQFITIGAFLVILAFAYLMFNRHKLKQKASMQEQMLKQQDVLTKAVIEAEENERQRIARDLHDGVGQLFSAVKMNLSGLLSRVEMTRDADKFLAEKTLALVDESCDEVRQISHQMMPNMQKGSGLAADVKSFVEKLDSEIIQVSFEATGFKNRMESSSETVLYRVIQEVVNNVIKHSGARNLNITVLKEGAEMAAKITDDGRGFDTKSIETFGRMGLKNIYTRVEYLKGSVFFDSYPGKGTSVEVKVPL